MSATTKIEWTNRTWNPIRGCSRVSQGCKNCYAERVAHRFAAPGRPYAGLTKRVNGKATWTGDIRLVHDTLLDPLTWRKPQHIFVNSMSDLFHENVPDDFIGQVFATMARCPQHTFQILTKRPERIARALGPRGCGFYAIEGPVPCPQPNVWLGVSVEDQESADARREALRNAPAAIRFVSYEPALGPIDWTGWEFLQWFISGGESGVGARPTHPIWHCDARDFCVLHGIAYFFKQWGEWVPINQVAEWVIDATYKSNRIARAGQDQGALDESYGRTCTVDTTCIWHDGSIRPINEPMAFLQGKGGMSCFRVGKRAAGRLLGGVEYMDKPVAPKSAQSPAVSVGEANHVARP